MERGIVRMTILNERYELGRTWKSQGGGLLFPAGDALAFDYGVHL
jgi:hypothetical protein